jgi:hypothetical protein
MTKTVDEILAPKPEARPRIYAYSIDDEAHAAAPTARPNSSPGQRPGYASQTKSQALKGRPNPCLNPSPKTIQFALLAQVQASVFRRRSLPWPCCATALLILCLLAATRTFAAAPILISSLELSPQDGPEILNVSLSRQPDLVHSFTLDNPARLVLDITPARLPGAKRDLAVDHPLLHGVRAAQFNTQTVRVVLDLKRETTHLITSRPPSGSHDEHQILVNLFAVAKEASPLDAPPAATSPLYPGRQLEQAPAESSPMGRSVSASNSMPVPRIFPFGKEPARKGDLPAEPTSRFGNLEVSGFAMLKGAQELQESGGPGQPRMFRNIIRVEGKWTPPKAAEAPGILSRETMFLLASLQSDYLWFGPDPSHDAYDLELYEGYLFRGEPGWDLRLGRQTVRWGKTDQISPVDNINPQDFREFILPDLEDRKIPNWMARMRLFHDAYTLEGIFVPFFEPDRFDFTGTKWALLAHQPAGIVFQESHPDKNLNNADWGLRTTATLAGWDLALSYLYAWEKRPHLRFIPNAPLGPTIRAEHHRQHVLGLEFETTLHKFGFRGEAAYFYRQSLNTRTLNSVAKPVVHYVLGVDYLGEHWYANVQFSHQHIVDYAPEILFLQRNNYYLSGEFNREFWRGKVMFKLGYALDLKDGAAFLTPEVILTYFDNLELTLGANLFSGPKDTMFGRYKDNDQLFLKAKYYF